MAQSPRLEQRIGQTLVMTPQLRQAIKLLQLSNLELTSFVEAELEKNPLLESNGPEAPIAPEEPAPADSERFDAAEPGEATEPAEVPDSAELASSDLLSDTAEAPLDADYENVYDGDVAQDGAVVSDAADPFGAAPTITGRGGRADFEDAGTLEDTLTSEKTLRDHLRDQLMVDAVDPVDRLIGHHLIELIDDAGYLTESLEPIAERLGCGLDRIEATLDILQRFEPPG